jgi:hypothetical protein
MQLTNELKEYTHAAYIAADKNRTLAIKRFNTILVAAMDTFITLKNWIGTKSVTC